MEAAKDQIHQKIDENKDRDLITKDDVEAQTTKEVPEEEEVKLDISEDEKKPKEEEEEENVIEEDEDDDSLIDHTIIKHGIKGLKKKIWVIASERKDFQQVKELEEKVIRKRRKVVGVQPKTDDRPVGVAFSGGGIRSASYCMGALRAMSDTGFLKQVDYLSTVSGGGYTGTAFMSHIMSEENGTIENAVTSLETAMRKHCGYVVDRRNICYTLRDIILIFLITISLVAFGKVPAIALAMYPVGVFFELIIGDIYVESALEGVTGEMKWILLGLGLLGFVLLVSTRIARKVLENTTHARRFTFFSFIRAGGYGVGFSTACLFSSLVVDDILNYIRDPGIVLWLAIIIFSATILFSLTRIVPIDALWLLFPMIGALFVGYTWFLHLALLYTDDERFDVYDDLGIVQNLDIIWSVLFIVWHVINTIGSTSLLHKYYSARLKSAFYNKHPSVRKTRWLGLRSHYRLGKGMANQVTIKKGGPYLLCNVTLNDYKQYPKDASYHSFTLAPLYSGSDITGFTETDAMKIGLEKAMALSGAAFATSMGRVQVAAIRTNEVLFSVLGVSMGDWIGFPIGFRWWNSTFLIPIIANVIAMVLVVLGVFLGGQNYEYAYLIAGGVLIYMFFFAMNLIPFKAQNSNSYVYAWKSMTEQNHILDLNVTGATSPPYLHLTDGGHFDNLGLVELLKRRCKKIVAFDAGHDPEDSCEDLFWSLNQFRKHCVVRAERFIKKTGTIKLVSLEEAVDRFKEHHSSSFIVIHVHWTRENIETVLWYVKLRRHEPIREGENVPVCGGLFGTLPFISTAFQFFDSKLFDILFTFGKQDFESVSEIMKGHSKLVNYDPMIPSKKRYKKRMKKRGLTVGEETKGINNLKASEDETVISLTFPTKEEALSSQESVLNLKKKEPSPAENKEVVAEDIKLSRRQKKNARKSAKAKVGEDKTLEMETIGDQKDAPSNDAKKEPVKEEKKEEKKEEVKPVKEEKKEEVKPVKEEKKEEVKPVKEEKKEEKAEKKKKKEKKEKKSEDTVKLDENKEKVTDKKEEEITKEDTDLKEVTKSPKKEKKSKKVKKEEKGEEINN